MKLLIIIPAYNEEKRIGKTLEEYCKYFKSKKYDFEIIVVINNTKDNTEKVVEDKKKKFMEISYLNFEKGGKGFAIKEGFKEGIKKNYDLIGFVDADMSTSPKAFEKLILSIENYSGVIASRWRKDSIIEEKNSVLRKIYSWGFNFLVRSILLLNYSDTQCGAKLFKKEAIEEILSELGITNWAFDIDLLYKLKKHKLKIKEVPTEWRDKAGSKIKLIDPIKMFIAIIRLRLLNSPFAFVVRAYDKFPEKIKIHHKI